MVLDLREVQLGPTFAASRRRRRVKGKGDSTNQFMQLHSSSIAAPRDPVRRREVLPSSQEVQLREFIPVSTEADRMSQIAVFR